MLRLAINCRMSFGSRLRRRISRWNFYRAEVEIRQRTARGLKRRKDIHEEDEGNDHYDQACHQKIGRLLASWNVGISSALGALVASFDETSRRARVPTTRALHSDPLITQGTFPRCGIDFEFARAAIAIVHANLSESWQLTRHRSAKPLEAQTV